MKFVFWFMLIFSFLLYKNFEVGAQTEASNSNSTDSDDDDDYDNALLGPAGVRGGGKKPPGTLQTSAYFKSVTIPTFIGLTILICMIFVILHLPNCCFGLFKEPSVYDEKTKV